jgi:hypothetical protein
MSTGPPFVSQLQHCPVHSPQPKREMLSSDKLEQISRDRLDLLIVIYRVVGGECTLPPSQES